MNAIQIIKLIAGLIGGLALFLYGMTMMTGALQKAAGSRLEAAINKVTSNRYLAYLFGFIVTAIVQSSSCSTVMTVGLVNSGIIGLENAANVILGANLGTTITAWLLSLNSISGGDAVNGANIVATLFKPITFSSFLALGGIGCLMFGKTDKPKNIGKTLIGFAIIMFGMNAMSSSMSVLKNNDSFQQLLTSFSNPFLGFLVGLAFTLCIQSSSGTIGVLQAMAFSVFLSYGTAIPIIIGAEVGTCVTALISSIGANKNGKRAALVHFYFNLIKAIIFMSVFYTIDAFVHFEFLTSRIDMVGIAVVHSSINLCATLLFLPFSKLLVKLAYLTIPVDKKEKEEMASKKSLTNLDPRFLQTPGFALEQAKTAANEMAAAANEAFKLSTGLISNYDPEKAKRVAKLEKRIDLYEDQLGTYLIKINSTRLSVENSHTLSILLHSMSDIERISDHALNIAEVASRMKNEQHNFSNTAKQELKTFTKAVEEIVDLTFGAFQANDIKLAAEVEPLEEVVDGLNMEIKRRHIVRLREGKCTIELGFDLNDVCTDYERISDHCSNIAVCILEVNKDVFDTHGYLKMVRDGKDDSFDAAVDAYEQKYRLPKLSEAERKLEDPISESFTKKHKAYKE